MWNRTGILLMPGRMGLPLLSRTVIVSCGAATIQVSGGWLSSVVGARALRQPTPQNARKRQSTAPTRKRIRALQHAQSIRRKWTEASNGALPAQAKIRLWLAAAANTMECSVVVLEPRAFA